MDFEPHITDGEDAGETLRAIRHALLGLEPGDPILFSPEGSDFESKWDLWLDRLFLPHIAPHLIAVQETCSSISPREVALLDAKFSSLLDPVESDRSLRAANALKVALAGARHRPELDKVLAIFASPVGGEQLGHFPTLFAARCASHHVPLASTLAAYLFFEILSASPKRAEDPPVSPAFTLPLIVPAVRKVLDSRPPDTYRVA